ncbi:MAG: hypothetical protein QG607_305 [Patescibacteria group bacterium]|jgi:gas vesicle protein|nr:hypothetical protein [Patescibacteria group bacterium]
MKKTTPKNKSGSHILGGALAGIALTVAAGIFSQTKTGKKIVKNVRDKSADFYKSLEPQLQKAKEMSETQLHKVIDASLAKYGKTKKLSKAEIKELSETAYKSWEHLKKNVKKVTKK